MATTDAPMNGALNERLLPKEQRPRADLPKSSATLGPSMKGCSRKSSDLDIHSSYHHSVRRPSMKGCSRKSSDRCATGRTRPPSQTLNERLLPKEQRRWRIEAVNVLARSPSMKGYSRKSSDRILSTVSTAAMIPSMKGCSRKSSDEQQSGALCSYAPSLNERLLPKEQRRSDQHASKRLIHVPSMKGCSRKSSDIASKTIRGHGPSPQ